MREDEICGTSNPTPHQVLLDARFELPFGMNTFSFRETEPIACRMSNVAKLVPFSTAENVCPDKVNQSTCEPLQVSWE